MKFISYKIVSHLPAATHQVRLAETYPEPDDKEKFVRSFQYQADYESFIPNKTKERYAFATSLFIFERFVEFGVPEPLETFSLLPIVFPLAIVFIFGLVVVENSQKFSFAILAEAVFASSKLCD